MVKAKINKIMVNVEKDLIMAKAERRLRLKMMDMKHDEEF